MNYGLEIVVRYENMILWDCGGKRIFPQVLKTYIVESLTHKLMLACMLVQQIEFQGRKMVIQFLLLFMYANINKIRVLHYILN